MTVDVTTIQNGPYQTNGVVSAFPYSFSPLSAGELQVIAVDAAGAETTLTGWTPTVLEGPGVASFDVPPNLPGQSIYVRLTPSDLQQIDFGNQDAFLPETFSEGFDRACQRQLVLEAEAIRMPFGEGFTLPESGGRASTIMGFDQNGDYTAISFGGVALASLANGQVIVGAGAALAAGYAYSANTATGAVSVVLPQLSAVTNGAFLEIMDVGYNAGVNHITAAAYGTDTIKDHGQTVASVVNSVSGTIMRFVAFGGYWRLFVYGS